MLYTFVFLFIHTMKQRNRAIRAPHLANAGPDRVYTPVERYVGTTWGARTRKPVTQLNQRGVIWV